MCILCGCVRYSPRPIEAGRILEELRSVTLEKAPRPDAQAMPSFDLRDGVSEEEAIAIALSLNPDLRALRAGKGVGEAQLTAAGLFPDPEIDARWLDRSDGTVLEGTLLQALPLWGERGLRKQKAKLRLEEIHFEVGSAEWRLAQETRAAFTDLMAAQEAVRLAASNLAIRERMHDLVKTRQELGTASPLEVNLSTLDVADLRRAARAAEFEQDAARRALNRLLGVGPRVAYTIQVPGDPWALRPDPLPAIERLEGAAVSRRLDVSAALRGYEQAEKDLQLATRGQYPRLRIGPSYGKEESESGVGIGASVEIPLWNRNRGEIAEKLAQRSKLFDEFRARVAALRSEIAEAVAQVDRQTDLVRIFETDVRPRLEQSITLTEEAFKAGKLDLAALLVLQDRVFETRQRDLETRSAYRKAWIGLESAVGAALAEFAKEKPMEKERR